MRPRDVPFLVGSRAVENLENRKYSFIGWAGGLGVKMKRLVFSLSILFCVSAQAADCDIGEYVIGDICASCPAEYPFSLPNASSINDCYLITDVGKYVPVAGVAMATCPENSYCPGVIPVFYDMQDRFHRIEYLKSTGTQYIDTGIILGSDIDTELIFETDSIKGDNVLFGANSSDRHYWLNGYTNFAYIRYNDYHPVSEPRGAWSINVKHIVEVRHGDWILDGETIYSNPGEFNVGLPGYLFAELRYDGSVKWPHEALKIFSFTQWRNDDKVLELIPVYDSVRDECGMLDLVTGKFLTNIGTGKFECGPMMDVDDYVGANGAAVCAVATDGFAPYSPAGSDDVLDCGRVLRFSDNYNLYLRTVPRTPHSLKMRFGGNIFYGDSTEQQCGHLRVKYQGQVLSICNMDVDI